MKVTLNLAQLTKCVSLKSGEKKNIVGKGENAGFQHFLLSQQCFQELFFNLSEVVTNGDSGRVKVSHPYFRWFSTLDLHQLERQSTYSPVLHAVSLHTT